MENMVQKVLHYFQVYADLYGTEMFLDNERIQKTMDKFKGLDELATVDRKNDLDTGQESEKKTGPLWAYREEIQNCQKCPLGSTRTKFVFGVGNANADILFIGEAPGAEEDRTGIPFVGRAGKQLDKLLKHISVRREDVFIANILKCRPPQNRDPLPEEVTECIPYLHQQIKLINPKVIVALGRVAAQNLLQTNSSLKGMRERLWQYRGINLIVTYHPAALLRNANLIDAALSDFKFILKTYQEK